MGIDGSFGVAAGAVGLELADAKPVQIASAMIERAEFPVQRNRTFRGGLLLTTCMGSRWTTAGLRRCDKAAAKLRLAATAVLHQEGQEATGSFKIDEIDDRSPLFARGHEIGARKCG